ncbi:hypothetical protein OROHE_014141 [Orobanche hederae]
MVCSEGFMHTRMRRRVESLIEIEKWSTLQAWLSRRGLVDKLPQESSQWMTLSSALPG